MKIKVKYILYTISVILVAGLTIIYVGHKYIYPIPFSATTTIPDIKKDGFCFGVNCQNSPKAVDDFIPVFANQIKNYTKIAPSIWPGNKVVNLYAAVESIENDKSWLISPSGEITKLTSSEIKALCPNKSRYNIGFTPFKNDTIQGVYLVLSEEALSNVLEYQKYQYLGTYDLLLTYNHEMFHIVEQDGRWVKPETINNSSRNPRLEDIDARTERNLIYTQLLNAYSSPIGPKRDSSILQVLSNFDHYKKSYTDDYKAAQYFDRIEGTAHYYEIISSLYSSYPETVHSTETLRKALKILAQSDNPKPYDTPGLDTESYIIGAWAGFILDEIQEDNTKWKNEIMQNPALTPMDILTQIYMEEKLPAPIRLTQERKEKVKASIQDMNSSNSITSNMFRFLYQNIF